MAIEKERDENRDPITGAPGAHPVGAGAGAAGGAATGAAVGGAVGGPAGAVVGAVVGGVAGGYAGKGIAEAIDPTAEEAYWRENYRNRDYVESGRSYEDYQPAYRTGYEGFRTYGAQGRRFEEVEPDLRRDYEAGGSSSAGLKWEQAKGATRDAWHRLESRFSEKQR